MNRCRFCEKPASETTVDSESVDTCCVWDLYVQVTGNDDWDSIDFKTFISNRLKK